jgi:hypothetical protein
MCRRRKRRKSLVEKQKDKGLCQDSCFEIRISQDFVSSVGRSFGDFALARKATSAASELSRPLF